MTTPVRPENMPWLTPYLCVKDADKALKFYQDAFGFEINDKVPGPDGKTSHAEMKYKNQIIIMLGPEGAWGNPTKAPISTGADSPVALYIYCDNVDEIHDRAIKAGAKSHVQPSDMFWGDRMCKLTCPDGHVWNFATYTGKMGDPSIKH